MNNKKGLGNQIMLLIVMAIVLIGLILIMFVWGMLGPPLQATLSDSNTIIQETFASSQDANLISAGQTSFGNATEGVTNNLEWVSYTMFILMFLVFLIMAFYVRTYPFLLVIWIILIVLMFFGSIYLTVVYQDLRADATLGAYYQSWENTDFILQNLPIITLMVGIIGGIIMFMLASRNQEVEQISGGYPI